MNIEEKENKVEDAEDRLTNDIVNENIDEIEVTNDKNINISKSNVSDLKASIDEPFATKKGYFYIHIYGNGKETKRKVDITLNSNDRNKTQTITFKESSLSGYSDNHNFQILTTSAKTQPTEQNSYSVFSFKFSYTKPAHYKAGHWYSDKTDDFRFNFNKSPTDTTTTVNNAGHNITDTTETINMQINLTNCGITYSGGEKSNATGHINLRRGYYADLQIDSNGGNHAGKTNKYSYGIKCCCTEAIIVSPTRKGYAFIGWSFAKGKNCGGASFDKSTSKFKYCGIGTSTSSVGSENTCTLKAEWIKNDDTLILPETGYIDFSILIILIRHKFNFNINN